MNCNHKYPNGKSAIRYDSAYEMRSSQMYCDICKEDGTYEELMADQVEELVDPDPGTTMCVENEIKGTGKTNILQTEYSNKFDELRKDRMIVSFYKYGSVKVNYEQKLIDSIKSLEKRLQMYKESGNTEFLCDIANFAMIEFMYPQHPLAHFKVLDDGKSHIIGMGINEINRFKDESKE